MELVELNIKVARNRRQNVDVSAGCCNLERLRAFALRVHVNQLTWLNAERRAVDALTVDQDVTVNNHLTSLGDGAGDAGTQNDGVETHFEKLDQVLTGQAVGTLGLLEGLAKLCLADAVLGA